MTAWETVGFGVTTAAAYGTWTAGVGYTGQTGTVRNTALGSKVNLEALWTESAQVSGVRVRSPRLHDNVRGIEYSAPVTSPYNLMGLRPQTPLVPQDLLLCEMTGAAADATASFLQISYASLPGSDGNYASYAQIQPRIVDIMTQEYEAAAVATANNWSVGAALNTFSDLMKANTWYALLGYTLSSTVGGITIQGPDTGGLKIGGPGIANPLETREWFCWMDEYGEEPGIPIINSANKAGTFIYFGDTGATVTTNLCLLFAELSGSTLPGFGG
jgi:hypothetical protein